MAVAKLSPTQTETLYALFYAMPSIKTETLLLYTSGRTINTLANKNLIKSVGEGTAYEITSEGIEALLTGKA